MGEVLGFLLLRVAVIGGGILLLALLLGVVVVALKRTGRFDGARRLVEPVVRAKLGRTGGYRGALGTKALDYLSAREKGDSGAGSGRHEPE